ncbi:MAG: septum formation initiator family protein [Bacteroidetes bacterium]|nr:septum formation initiator family protein [Bacteroidota bacterium]
MKKPSKIIGLLKNKYILTFVAFVVWLIFFDKNDILSQVKLTKQLSELEQEKEYYIKEIKNNKTQLKELQTNKKELERFAREKYFMKKDNEDIFVFYFDSTTTSISPKTTKNSSN